MALPLDQFVKQLEDSGVIAPDKLQDFLPPNSTPKGSEGLVRELVRKKQLTSYQAQLIWQGKAKSLVLGNYVLLEKIGVGGMGQVFKARHRVMDRIVAIKVLPPAMTRDKSAVQRFHREVKAAARLVHPNIVAAYDADCAHDVHFLVMQYVEGHDLAELVKQNGPLSVEQGVDYILQAARGLEAAHAEGVVHRDIKPANLLLDKKGTIRILDMGLARLSAEGTNPSSANELTATGMIMGTIDYMSPEQALNTRIADARADIYSLGCSLYYLLIGKVVYAAPTMVEKVVAHRDQPIPSLRALRDDVPERLDSVFRRMVAKKPEGRQQSMADVVADLEQFQPGLSRSSTTLAATPTVAVMSSISASPDPSEMSIAMGHQLLRSVEFNSFPAFSDDKSTQDQPQKEAKKRAPVSPAAKALIAVAVMALLAGILWLLVSGKDKPEKPDGTSPRSSSQ